MKQHADLLQTLAELSRRYPEWRFGQLVANVAGWADRNVWDVEDIHLLEAARLHLDQLTPTTALTAPAATPSSLAVTSRRDRTDYEEGSKK
jgi:hypothetical protein